MSDRDRVVLVLPQDLAAEWQSDTENLALFDVLEEREPELIDAAQISEMALTYIGYTADISAVLLLIPGVRRWFDRRAADGSSDSKLLIRKRVGKERAATLTLTDTMSDEEIKEKLAKWL